MFNFDEVTNGFLDVYIATALRASEASQKAPELTGKNPSRKF